VEGASVNRVTIDHQTLAKLGDLSQQLEIFDESGRLLGYFRPAKSPSPYDQIIPPFSDEELRERADEPGVYTTDQVLKRLEDLDV
jgi:hypothetical protein